MSEIFEYVIQLSRHNYPTEKLFLEKIDYVVRDHFENYKSQFYEIKEVFLKYEKNEIIVGDILNYWKNNVVLNFEPSDYDTPELMIENIIQVFYRIKDQEECTGFNPVITLTSYLLPDIKISV